MLGNVHILGLSDCEN